MSTAVSAGERVSSRACELRVSGLNPRSWGLVAQAGVPGGRSLLSRGSCGGPPADVPGGGSLSWKRSGVPVCDRLRFVCIAEAHARREAILGAAEGATITRMPMTPSECDDLLWSIILARERQSEVVTKLAQGCFAVLRDLDSVDAKLPGGYSVVTIDLDESSRRLTTRCTCPAFARGGTRMGGKSMLGGAKTCPCISIVLLAHLSSEAVLAAGSRESVVSALMKFSLHAETDKDVATAEHVTNADTVFFDGIEGCEEYGEAAGDLDARAGPAHSDGGDAANGLAGSCRKGNALNEQITQSMLNGDRLPRTLPRVLGLRLAQAAARLTLWVASGAEGERPSFEGVIFPRKLEPLEILVPADPRLPCPSCNEPLLRVGCPSGVKVWVLIDKTLERLPRSQWKCSSPTCRGGLGRNGQYHCMGVPWTLATGLVMVRSAFCVDLPTLDSMRELVFRYAMPVLSACEFVLQRALQFMKTVQEDFEGPGVRWAAEMLYAAFWWRIAVMERGDHGPPCWTCGNLPFVLGMDVSAKVCMGLGREAIRRRIDYETLASSTQSASSAASPQVAAAASPQVAADLGLDLSPEAVQRMGEPAGPEQPGGGLEKSKKRKREAGVAMLPEPMSESELFHHCEQHLVSGAVGGAAPSKKLAVYRIPPVLHHGVRGKPQNTEVLKRAQHSSFQTVHTDSASSKPSTATFDTIGRAVASGVLDPSSLRGECPPSGEELDKILKACGVPEAEAKQMKSDAAKRAHLLSAYWSLFRGATDCHVFASAAYGGGGLQTISCHHGYQYGWKHLIHQESVRDAKDMMFSLKTIPNLILDVPCGLSAHVEATDPDAAKALWGDTRGCWRTYQWDEDDMDLSPIDIPEYEHEARAERLREVADAPATRDLLASHGEHVTEPHPLVPEGQQRFCQCDAFHQGLGSDSHKHPRCLQHAIRRCTALRHIGTSFSESINSRDKLHLRATCTQDPGTAHPPSTPVTQAL